MYLVCLACFFLVFFYPSATPFHMFSTYQYIVYQLGDMACWWHFSCSKSCLDMSWIVVDV